MITSWWMKYALLESAHVQLTDHSVGGVDDFLVNFNMFSVIRVWSFLDWWQGDLDIGLRHRVLNSGRCKSERRWSTTGVDGSMILLHHRPLVSTVVWYYFTRRQPCSCRPRHIGTHGATHVLSFMILLLTFINVVSNISQPTRCRLNLRKLPPSPLRRPISYRWEHSKTRVLVGDN